MTRWRNDRDWKKWGNSGGLRLFLLPGACVEPAISSAEGPTSLLAEHPGPQLEEQVGTRRPPLHLLLLDHPFADHLIDRRFDKSRANPRTDAEQGDFADEIGTNKLTMPS